MHDKIYFNKTRPEMEKMQMTLKLRPLGRRFLNDNMSFNGHRLLSTY